MSIIDGRRHHRNCHGRKIRRRNNRRRNCLGRRIRRNSLRRKKNGKNCHRSSFRRSCGKNRCWKRRNGCCWRKKNGWSRCYSFPRKMNRCCGWKKWKDDRSRNCRCGRRSCRCCGRHRCCCGPTNPCRRWHPRKYGRWKKCCGRPRNRSGKKPFRSSARRKSRCGKRRRQRSGRRSSDRWKTGGRRYRCRKPC